MGNLLTGAENLRLMADLHHLGRAAGRQRTAELLERFDLTGAAGQMTATYSGGMRRRLDLAMTLLGEPRIIFLDEPTTGLDPRSRRTMWQIIRELAGDGVTVFLTTQYLDEADQLAGRIAVLDHGRLVAEGTPDELKRRIPGGALRLHFADRASLDAVAAVFGGAARDDEGLVLSVPSDGTPQSIKTLLDRLDRHCLQADSVSVHTPDLDDVFFALTGQPKEGQDTRHEHSVFHRPRLGHDAAPRRQACAPVPDDDDQRPVRADLPAAAVRRHVRPHAAGRPGRGHAGRRPVHRLPGPWHSW